MPNHSNKRTPTTGNHLTQFSQKIPKSQSAATFNYRMKGRASLLLNFTANTLTNNVFK
jgi:hypothetical protein